MSAARTLLGAIVLLALNRCECGSAPPHSVLLAGVPGQDEQQGAPADLKHTTPPALHFCSHGQRAARARTAAAAHPPAAGRHARSWQRR